MVVAVKENKAQIGITAPTSVPIARLELLAGCAQGTRLPAVARNRQKPRLSRPKKHFQLGPKVAVVSVYEAGREGFGLHRWLLSVGVSNVDLTF